jgi:hypothetical protein
MHGLNRMSAPTGSESSILPPLKSFPEGIERWRIRNECRCKEFSRRPSDADSLGVWTVQGPRDADSCDDYDHQADAE